MELAVVDTGVASVKQEESTSSESRSVEKISKDLGHTQIVGKAETYEASKSSKLVEENRSTDVQEQVQASRSVVQSVSQVSSSSVSSKQDTQISEELPQTLSEQLNSIKESEKAILGINLQSSQENKDLNVENQFQTIEVEASNKETIDNTNAAQMEVTQEKISQPLKKFDIFDATSLINENTKHSITNYKPGQPIEQFACNQINLYDEEIKNNFSHINPYVYIPKESDNSLKSPALVKEFVSLQHQRQSTEFIKDEKITSTLKEVISDLDIYAQKDSDLNDSLIGDLKSCLRVQGDQDYDLQEDDIGHRNPISLEKIFTPAEDCVEIKPNKNRKMFASSAFYDSGFHPTVEDQVELARKISNSLSDVNNKSSKGQNMYVNRKKRSVKWVHENKETQNGHFQNGESSEQSMESKSMLKLVMNPLGQIQDIDSLKKQGFLVETALSPDIYAGIVKDLNSPNGKGAELFAKRRKRSEKWVVGETNGAKNGMDSVDIIPSPAPLLSPLPPLSALLSPAPGYLPETTQRIQHKEKLDEIQAQFIRPKLKLVKSPWEAALETGSVETAFENVMQPPSWGPTRGAHVAPTVAQYEHALQTNTLDSWKNDNPVYQQPQSSINRIVDNLQKGSASNIDVYKPKVPQAWNQHQDSTLNQPKQYSSNSLPRNLKPSHASSAPAFELPASAEPVYNNSANDYATNYTPPKENIPPPKIHNLSFVNQYGNVQNYNTAARGWTHKQTIYKPVTFGSTAAAYRSAGTQPGWDYTDF